MPRTKVTGLETIENVQEIKINNYEDLKRWKWEAIQARIYRLNLKVLKINNAQSLGAQFINSMMNIAVTFYCAIAVINGDITFGVMISTAIYYRDAERTCGTVSQFYTICPVC